MGKTVNFNPKKDMKFLSKYKRKYYEYHLKSLKSFYFLVGDIEAYLDENNEFVFKVGIFFDGNSYNICETVEDYYESIKKYFEDRNINKKDRKIYFHNLNFDIIFFLREISFKTNINIINSGNMFLKMDNKDFIFLNSLSILPMSLKKVVKIWLKIEFKEWENQKDDIFSLNYDELIDYCKRDNFLLYFALFKLFSMVYENYGIKNFLTIPSLSMNIFKNFYNKSKFLENKSSNFFKEDYYFGGHTEKFINGVYFFKENINYYDVNSLYPFIMKDLEVCESRFKMYAPTIKNVFKFLYEERNFFIDCEIEIKSDMYRVIPVKYGEKNYYPLGKFRCKISHLTVSYLLKNKQLFLIKVYGLISHLENTKTKPFKNFIEDNYKRRKSDYEYDLFYKFVMNSSYGKFGQNEEQTKMIINAKSFDNFDTVTSFGCNHLCSVKSVSSYKPDYLRKDVAGLITEKARILMNEYRNIFYSRGKKTYYQDTDSLIVNDFCDNDYVLKNYIDSKVLGLLKRENDKPVDEAIIIGLKLYSLYKGLQASKGVKKMYRSDYIRIGKALIIKNLINNIANVRFFISQEKYKICLKIYPRLFFYNDRFTQPKSFIKKGFFGIQRVPFYITEISEKLDKIPLSYYLKK